MLISFSKYQGAGNDFILIDDRSLFFPADNSTLIERLCHRRFGIGADGLILLQKSTRADFKMRIFNADGKEPAMCGNGIRCLLTFLSELGIKEKTYKIETLHSVVSCYYFFEKWSFSLFPNIMHRNITIRAEEKEFCIDVLDTGVPHAVIFVEDVQKVDLMKWGKAIRFHPLFAPHGVNVNFAEVSPLNNEIRMRTYERGVEGETLACGTGAAAVAFIASEKSLSTTTPAQIHCASKDVLFVGLNTVDGRQEIVVAGSTLFVFEGKVDLKY